MFQERRAYRVTERFRRWGIVSWSLIGVLILAGFTGWALLQVSEIFPPLVLALVTIYLLNPVVSGLERVGVPRLAGSCLTYILLIAVVVVALVFLVPLIVHQFEGFVKDFPRTLERISELADRVTRTIRDRFPSFDLGEWLRSQSEGFGANLGGIGHFLLGAVQTIAMFIIGPVIAFYLLVDLPRLQRTAIRLIPPQRRAEVIEVASSVGGTMGNFFRGQLIVALIVGIMASIAMRIIGLPYWLVVGMIAGLFNLIPLIGPFIGAIPGILIAGALRTPWHMLWVALGMLVVQQIDNHFISPNVMRFTVRLHPVTVMVALIAGATLAGFWGMLLAVPGLASIKLVAAHFWRTRVPWGYDVFEEPPPTTTAGVPPGEPPQEVREARAPGPDEDVRAPVPADRAQAAPETLPPETLPPETLPPETLPPETLPDDATS